MKPIVITAGGTGGHIFPAEALAKELLERNCPLVFITDKRGKHFSGPLSNLPTYFVSAQAMTGKKVLFKIMSVFKLLWGILQSLYFLLKVQPKLLVGFGGYASIPATLAAQFLHIPVILHEQNAVLGRANRLLSWKVNTIATSFMPTERLPKHTTVVETGMPTRPAVLQLKDSTYTPPARLFNLLIMGGSQGARVFSSVIPEALKALPPKLKSRLVITQQVRAEDMEKVQKAYEGESFHKVDLQSFFTDMPERIAKSHLVISRSGSSSLAELAIIGRPSILVPLPIAADDHQTRNAQCFADKNAAWLMVEKDFTAQSLALRVEELMDQPALLKRVAEAAHKLGQPQAAQKLADIVLAQKETRQKPKND
ncbi:MAG: undecaprenyldiphospho-muramoylpentapeptide beta-N-acetylglucosaminyltransferase [Alphaproteobacteria bacterium]|nr:undecaprenyldiphospho-muramoylpentapeptide beta-N-acetylglucosaminyltransferase [Alphaproteobacteria bacterium]